METPHPFVETFQKNHIDALAVPGVMVCKHGSFTWGKNSQNAFEDQAILDEIAHMLMLDKHYHRRYGANAYYRQKQII